MPRNSTTARTTSLFFVVLVAFIDHFPGHDPAMEAIYGQCILFLSNAGPDLSFAFQLWQWNRSEPWVILVIRVFK